ncbi:hypothetical protein FA13DRAFT_1792487 [Coprinellus micaceus]|uniref:Uncharacterized protein n=1 Tax=Coprinellus micaceus TaxID=71717 RepID=A0A4Y7T8N2_COPMI|nr:hypothetical protein FA13DRAFT_1792487 [Coprinellus micaceus]
MQTCAGCSRAGLTRTGYCSHLQQSTLPECLEEHWRVATLSLPNRDTPFDIDIDCTLPSSIRHTTLPSLPHSGGIDLAGDEDLAMDVEAGPVAQEEAGMDDGRLMEDVWGIRRDGPAFKEGDDEVPGPSGEDFETLNEELQCQLNFELEATWEPTREPTNAQAEDPQMQQTPIQQDDGSPVLIPAPEEEPGDNLGNLNNPPPPPPPPSLSSPVIIKYSQEHPGTHAGCAVSSADGEDKVYRQTVGTDENMWVLFTTKLDWEVAKWVKLRGPGSTAVSELLVIEGVVNALNLSFKNANELNKCINNHLPQHPQFERHEIIVAGKSFELYAHDIVECIRALWGDPEFAPYLVFEPEHHYANKNKTQQLYHDMHTGKWRWATHKQIERETGKKNVTVVPIIILSDKTQLTTFLFACSVGDYPEQTLIGAVKQGDGPVYPATCSNLDEEDPDWDFRDMDTVMEALDSLKEGATIFRQWCQEAGIKPVQDPFWKDLPFVHVNHSITPDLLHQLYQGVVKHLILWLHILFLKGISHLLRVTGTEHDQICRFLLASSLISAFLMGTPTFAFFELFEAFSTSSILLACLFRIQEALMLLMLPLRHSPTIETFSSILRSRLISAFQKYTRRLHIDMAKDAYRSTNHKDEYPQMTAWLDRQERIMLHSKYLQRRLDLRELPPLPIVPLITPPCILKMALHPTTNRVSFAGPIAEFGAVDFKLVLKRFIVHFRNPAFSKHQVEDHAATMTIPFEHVPVFHWIKFVSSDPHSLTPNAKFVVDSVHFLVHYKNQGLPSLQDYCIACVQCIFSLPPIADHLFHERTPPKHLAYID